MGLTDFFLQSRMAPKIRLTGQGEYAHIRPSSKSSPADVRYYTLQSITFLFRGEQEVGV
jgi:hypothetical protein